MKECETCRYESRTAEESPCNACIDFEEWKNCREEDIEALARDLFLGSQAVRCRSGEQESAHSIAKPSVCWALAREFYKAGDKDAE